VNFVVCEALALDNYEEGWRGGGDRSELIKVVARGGLSWYQGWVLVL